MRLQGEEDQADSRHGICRSCSTCDRAVATRRCLSDPETQGGGLGAGTRQVMEPVTGGRPGRYGTEPGSTCEAWGGTGFFESQFEAHLSE